MLASRPGGAIYTGVTNDLSLRVWTHKQGRGGLHTKRYGICKLVYYETYEDVRTTIQRERNIKHWPRAWKCNLIYGFNPTWRDLYLELNGAPDASPIGMAGTSPAMTRSNEPMTS
jgi:putative endonuclease